MQSKTKLMEVLENKANGSCVSVCGGSIAVFGVVGKCERIVLYHASLNLQFGMFLDYNSGFCFFFFSCFKQECDQVHIEDVASDDNGQDLR